MSPDERQAEWTAVSKPWDGKDQPPPWPLDEDTRTPQCQHNRITGWAKAAGEQQRRCRRCRRWIWDHEWYSQPEEQQANG